jgi:protein-tyrosine phosphatase
LANRWFLQLIKARALSRPDKSRWCNKLPQAILRKDIAAGRIGMKIRIFFVVALCASGLAAFERTPETATQGIRVIELEGARNFRDIGGYETADGRTVKWGQVYRSDKLSDLTQADYKVLDDIDLETIVDFRSDAERADAQTKWGNDDDPDILNLSIGDNAADWSSTLSRQLRSGNFTKDEITATFIDMYRAIPIDAAGQYKIMFERLADGYNRPLLMHCTAGKDRTGVGTALILSALGVPRTTIMDDFLLTNEVADVDRALYFVARGFGERAGHEIDPESLRPLVGVDAAYLETTFETIESEYGSVNAYLTEALGVTPDIRTQLQNALLE